jgi:ketosteroid isomerase-like protein
MKRLIFVIVWVFIVSCLSFGQAKPKQAAAPAGQNAVQEITDLENAWNNAALKYDVSWYERNIADSYISTDENGVVENKSAMIAHVKSKAFKAVSYALENLRIQAYGDAAVSTGTSVVKGTFKGKDISGKYPWTDTWVKLGGRWQCVAGHNSKIASK